MAYLMVNGEKHNISNFDNIDSRCTCESDHYTYIKNPIRIGLRSGMKPIVFKSNNEPYDEAVQQGRALTFCGCICELDKISKNYKIYGAMHPSQYNWNPMEVNKTTGKRRGGITDLRRIESWAR